MRELELPGVSGLTHRQRLIEVSMTMEPAGFEPAASDLQSRRSTN